MAIRADRVGVRQDQVDVHGRVTSPSFLNELLENLPEWTDMPVWVNGTEEVLPSNTSVPVTSPILADIAYPDIRRDNQYFTYRESPTPVDGLAKIKSIKGNTLVWNQLVENGNFESISKWLIPNGTGSVSNNVLTVTATGTNLQIYMGSNYTFTQGHKIYLSCWIKSSVAINDVRLRISQDIPLDNIQYISKNLNANERTNISGIITAESDTINTRFSIFILNSASGDVYTVDSFVAFDLTQMGLDISNPSEFTSLFPLPYYAYNTGTLLSFNGTGLKTVGKNLFDQNSVLLSQDFVQQSDGSYYKENLASLSNVLIWKNSAHITGALNIKFEYKNINTTGSGGLRIVIIYTDGTSQFVYNSLASEFTLMQYLTNSSKTVDNIVWDYGSSVNGTYIKNFIISVDNIDYEPYTSHTTNLPISTYFPTGMKSAGTVYDELTPTKAITRIGAVDLGSLDWIHRTEVGDHIFSCNVTNSVLYKRQLSVNFEVARYTNGGTVIGVTDMLEKDDKTLCVYFTTNTGERYIYIKDNSFNDATALKNSLSGAYLFYELATPVELPTMSFE